MKYKKSQAAMEFLMTYGWAILVVLVAIGALAYFGVLKQPQTYLSDDECDKLCLDLDDEMVTEFLGGICVLENETEHLYLTEKKCSENQVCACVQSIASQPIEMFPRQVIEDMFDFSENYYYWNCINWELPECEQLIPIEIAKNQTVYKPRGHIDTSCDEYCWQWTLRQMRKDVIQINQVG